MRAYLIFFIFLATFNQTVYANGGAAALDEMIRHHQEGIFKAKKVENKNEKKELNKLFKDLIGTHEKELKRMIELREKLFSKEVREPTNEFAEELAQLEKDFSELFGRFQSVMNHEKKAQLSPRIEIKENKDSYDIKAEIPGVESDEIKVKMVGNSLQIEGKREEEIRRENKNQFSSEFNYGEFKRLIPLEDKVDVTSLRVQYKDGILLVHLNKA